ncbi:hypothetical protein H632_c2533p1 [Helicosporidium sp. ATCC 50920]|nr:hypothetical protein H632_c2533p1 [Helicosporidium sp. ATCC 50920]|eukprot:KDD73106.1 hypothetical protein H632_c2533p1 [Helicosporidium sp. ATCC 50920]
MDVVLSRSWIWQDGTGNPEHALDQFNLVGKYEALGWLLGGLSVFGGLVTYARCSGVEKRRPWADKEVLVPPQVSQTFAKSS